MKPFFHSGLCTCVHAVTILKSFFRILKLRTSPSHRTGTCNLSRFLSNSSFVTVHSSYSFTLSVFLLSPCSGTARKCLRRPVFSFGHNLTFSDVTTVCNHRAVTYIAQFFWSCWRSPVVSEPTILSSSYLFEHEDEVFSRRGVSFS